MDRACQLVMANKWVRGEIGQNNEASCCSVARSFPRSLPSGLPGLRRNHQRATREKVGKDGKGLRKNESESEREVEKWREGKEREGETDGQTDTEKKSLTSYECRP